MPRFCRSVVVFVFVVLPPTAGLTQIAQAQAAAEADSFRLHKFAKPIGWEHYRISPDSGSLHITSSFEFTDRGSPVPLEASATLRNDLSPVRMTVKGRVSRLSGIDDDVTVAGGTATIRVDSTKMQKTVNGLAFSISGYAPMVMQQELLRYWERHGRPSQLQTLPTGSVKITPRGVDTATVNGQHVLLRRFAVDGLIWGRETVWLDDASRLAAAVTIDAEFDHFEAVRPEFEDALGHLIGRAGADGAVALAELSSATRGESGAFALFGGTVIDATGAPPIADAVVVVNDGRITAVGPRSSTTIPRGARRIDVTGKFIVPGLWDMHAHYEQVEWGPIYLAAGVTTARDVGNEFEFIAAVRQAIAAKKGIGPRLLLAGIIDGPGPTSLGVQQASTPAEGVRWVQQYHDAGFDQIKIYSSITPPVLAEIARTAHALGMTVTGHVPNGMSTRQAIDSGMDQINHIAYVASMFRGGNGATPVFSVDSSWAINAIAFLKAHHTVVDPTLALTEFGFHPASQPFEQIEPGVTHMPAQLREIFANSGLPAGDEERGRVRFEQLKATIGALHRAGVPIVAGTDQAVPGYSVHREMELYVQSGFTPLEALQAATLVPATVMHLVSEVGTVTAGKRADLLVVDANPLDDVANLRKIALVVSNGQRYLPAPLWRSAGFEP